MGNLEIYQELLLKKKVKGLADLFFFNKYVVEQDPERRKFIVPHVHGEWSEWFTKSEKRIQCILVPRSCFKSTFFTVGWSLQLLASNPSLRILIANATLDNAQKFLGEIGSHIKDNPEYKQLYGNLYNRELRWNENEIVVSGRRTGVREPSISVAGVGGNLVSRHFDIIIGDDLVNAENSATRFQSEKVIDWWKRSLSLLEPNGKMLLIGTRWAYHELYSYLIDNMKSEVDFYIRGAHNSDGSLYFPERFTETKLKELRKLHGNYIYSCFYNNDPVDEEEAIIKKSQIKYYSEAPENLSIFCACDPAISQGGQADSSAYLTVGVASNGDWYVLEALQEKSTVAEMIERLFIQNHTWRPLSSCLEVIGQAQGLLSPIHDEEERRKVYLPLLEIKALPQVTKEMRIRSILQPRFERGSVFIKEDMIELEEQLLKFPRAKKDDLCLSGDTLVFTSEGNIPIKNIKMGDMVLTRKGFRRVVAQEMTGIKKTISRFGLTATPNHPIITPDGIKDFNIVKASDIIHLWIKKPSSTTGKDITDIPTQREEVFGYIFGDTVQGFRFLCTDRYGSTIMEKFRLGLLFIIKTIIHLIMKFLTFNSYQIKNIVVFTPKKEANGLRKTLKSPKRLRNGGTKAKKEENGTNYTLKICGKIRGYMKSFVFNAGNFLRHITKTPFFVKDLTVARNGEKSIEVYNLKIADSHEFFANGILVHNCDALAMIESIAYEPQTLTLPGKVYDSKLEEQINKPSVFERFADEVMGDEF